MTLGCEEGEGSACVEGGFDEPQENHDDEGLVGASDSDEGGGGVGCAGSAGLLLLPKPAWSSAMNLSISTSP